MRCPPRVPGEPRASGRRAPGQWLSKWGSRHRRVCVFSGHSSDRLHRHSRMGPCAGWTLRGPLGVSDTSSHLPGTALPDCCLGVTHLLRVAPWAKGSGGDSKGHDSGHGQGLGSHGPRRSPAASTPGRRPWARWWLSWSLSLLVFEMGAMPDVQPAQGPGCKDLSAGTPEGFGNWWSCYRCPRPP